jgi:hypothetical protein
MRLKTFLFAIVASVILSSIVISAQNPADFHIASFMSAQELQDSGLTGLSARQRAALDQWFGRYTKLMINTLAGSGNGMDYPTSKGHSIDEVCADGSIVILEDDSVWAIESTDQIDTALWLTTTDINVSHLTHPNGDYKFLLTNTEDHEKAHAKYLGKKD